MADPHWLIVTPRMLLSHSSGLQKFTDIEADRKMHLHFDPGTSFLYYGEGINLVQFVIEQKLGKPLDELLRQALFTPPGMTHTGLIYREEFGADIADRFGVDGKFHAATRRFPARGAGSMTTRAEDLARFAIAPLNGKLLKRATQAEMFKPVLPLPICTSFHSPPTSHPARKRLRRAGVRGRLGTADEDEVWPGILQKRPRGRC